MTDIDTTKLDQVREAQLADQRAKEKPREKDQPSSFDLVLQQSRQQQPQKILPDAAAQQGTEQGSREMKYHEEAKEDRGRRQHHEREGERETKTKERNDDGKFAEGRVIAKNRLREGKGNSGSSSGRQGFGSDKQRRGVVLQLKKGGGRSSPLSLVGRFERELKASIAQAATAPRMTQDILNKLVEYVRFGLNRQGDKEIHIDLHEKVFRGLKLRVTSREGKVSVQFRTSDTKARQLLEKHNDALRDALSKKGIEVDEIVIS